MSYSAIVICNCYKNGMTTEPPYKEYLCIEDEGIYLAIPDGLWEKDNELVYKMDRELDEWIRTACEHKDMQAACEYLSNFSGMGAFRHIVQVCGGKNKYPILTDYLPTSNSGVLPAMLSEKLLFELNQLQNESTPEELVLLKEKSTGDLKASVSTDTYHLFAFTAYNKFNYGIDKDGFFILENVKDKNKTVSNIMFRSSNFVQQTISKDAYKFIDLPTGACFECSVGLQPFEKNNPDFEFLVTIEQKTVANEYEYMIEPLKRLATASIRTGNPIAWL